MESHTFHHSDLQMLPCITVTFVSPEGVPESPATMSGIQKIETDFCQNYGMIKLTYIRYFLSGDFSDLTVKCQDDTYKVHKVVLASQSRFFEAAVSNGFQVNVQIIFPCPSNPQPAKY